MSRNALIRLLIVLVAALLGALVVFAGVLVSDDGVEAGSTVVFDPGSAGSTVTSEASTPTDAGGSSEATEPPGGSEGVETVELTELVEVYRSAYSFTGFAGGVMWVGGGGVTASEAGVRLPTGMRLVSAGTAPGLEGCRAGSGDLLDNPVSWDWLDVVEGWYGCSQFGPTGFMQTHLVYVDPVAGDFTFEIVRWDRPGTTP